MRQVSRAALGHQALRLHRYQTLYLRGSISGAGELFKLLLQGMKIDPPYSLSRAKPLFYTAVAEAKRKPLVLID